MVTLETMTADRDFWCKKAEAAELQVGATEGLLNAAIKGRDDALRLYSELRKLAWACVGEVGMNDTLRPLEEFLKRTEPEKRVEPTPMENHEHRYDFPIGTNTASAMVCRFCGKTQS